MSFEYVNPLLEMIRSNKEAARSTYRENAHQEWPTADLGRGRQAVDSSRPPPQESAPNLLRGWLALSVTFQLQTPWFAKDDLPFHVLDNPLRRDRLTGAPTMSAASWKGLLRWSCRMRMGLLAHLEAHSNELTHWKDAWEISHLFGAEQTDEASAEDSSVEAPLSRGTLAFRPTPFDKVGFEMINPHDRAKKAGKNPILYEVVPAGAIGTLKLLYAPPPGRAIPPGFEVIQALQLLISAVDDLLTKYGFSAKRTSGWGLATVQEANIQAAGQQLRKGSLATIRQAIPSMLGDKSR
jgi:CRISPR-associated protein Cmr2